MPLRTPVPLPQRDPPSSCSKYWLLPEGSQVLFLCAPPPPSLFYLHGRSLSVLPLLPMLRVRLLWVCIELP